MIKKFKTMDGNEACSHIAYMFTEVAGIYPITPSSSMAEHVDEWSSKGLINIFNDQIKLVEMQSEGGAAGFVHGSLQSGVLTSTFTSSQGLLLMIPNMYKIAGEMLPGVIHVAARSLSTHALSILGDHQDIYATRMTGFAMMANSSVQQVMDLSAIAHLSAIHGRIPFLNFFDGFRTSHELQKIEVLDKEDLIDLVDNNAINEFRKRSLYPRNKVARGTAEDEDVYFQATEVRNKYYQALPDIVNSYMESINNITGRDYKPFNYYGNPNATDIIVAMGSVCETIKETIDNMNDNVGLIEVHLYRPFSKEYFMNVLPKTVQRIAVLDRTKEPGSSGEPLYLDVLSMFNEKGERPLIIGGRYGLSSKDTDPAQIKAVYDFLRREDNFTGFTVGINDDVTNLSIPVTDFKVDKTNVLEFLIYGYGSDGMESCSKDIIKIVGDNSNTNVQGYFQHDSKKSGGLTRSHLRFSSNPIRSTYYVSDPSLVVCSKESYLCKYDMLTNIKDNGIFLYVSSLNEEQLVKTLSNGFKKILATKHLKFYIIDAYKVANDAGLKNKISMVLEACIFKISNMMDFDYAYNQIRDHIKVMFAKKGTDVVESNLKAIEDTLIHLKEVSIDPNWANLEDEVKLMDEDHNKVFKMMLNLEGNKLSVSDFMNYKDGSYISGTTKYEKRGIAENIPSWIPENCIQCNQCSFVCPHAVIRPYLLNEDEYNNAPDIIKDKAINANGSNYKFQIGISTLDCTGCSLCSKVCPGKNGQKALEMHSFEQVDINNGIEYLNDKVSEKEDQIRPNVKGSQFKKPLFEYSGACAGCGETPYLKLLTQLFGDRMVIANATGCSSIYGSSMPSMPYSIPWASSLFEDNAEYGYGMLIGSDTIRNRIHNLITENISSSDPETKDLLDKWINNYDNYAITKEIYEKLDYDKAPYLRELKEYIPTRSIWAIGGDGWAYDIDFGGLDHVLSTNDNINILVLDTEVYSNTGGQASKASARGSISKFAYSGKKNAQKDLARMVMSYPNVYVAQVSMGANMNQTINAFIEAEKHQGPSIIIAYSPCINHGIKKGMEDSMIQEKKVVESGYFPIFRYKADEKIFSLDYKTPNFDLFEEFFNSENRFAMLKAINEEHAKELLEQTKEDAIKRFNYYKSLDTGSR